LSDSDEAKNARAHDYFLKGSIFKEIVKAMLEKSGYTVYPYGYESALPDVIKKLRDARDSETTRRIKSSPDLLVYDDQVNDLMLVEVKMRSRVPPQIKPREIENYKEFWNDCILVVVVPEGNVFYAQRIGQLETKEVYYRIEDFERFQDLFARVRTEDVFHYKDIALQNMRMHKPYSPYRYRRSRY
jgi:hypothetical protein